MGHYNELEQKIKDHYKRKSAEVDIEPHGSRGPDIKGSYTDGEIIIGEIKKETEIYRDLNGYWGQWNSNRSFGGKTNDYKLKNNYSDKGKGLSSLEVKGWASVIDGQLRGYCEKDVVLQGDLVIENFDIFKNEIQDAVEYLKSQDRIEKFFVETDTDNIGYATVNYMK